MSDYVPNPNDPRNLRDPLNARDPKLAYEPPVGSRSGNGIYIVMASLVVAVLVAGFLMFSGPRTDRIDQATVPATAPPIERTTPMAPAPINPANPAPTTPATPQQR